MKTTYTDSNGTPLTVPTDENGWIAWWGNTEAPLSGCVEAELANHTKWVGDASWVTWRNTTAPDSVVVYRPINDYIWREHEG